MKHEIRDIKQQAHGVRQKNKKGSALMYALVIMTVVMVILVSMMSYISGQLRFSFNRVEKEKAFQVAEAGIYYYRWYLAHQTSGKTALEINTYLQTGGPMGFSPAAEDYEGIGEYQLIITPPVAGSTVVNVKSIGWSYKVPDMKRTISVRFRRPSWSEYIFLSNSFINFGDQAEVFGKVHSNGGIRFDGIAHSMVSSLLPKFDDPTWGGNRLQFGVHTTNNPADPDAPAYPWPSGTVPDRPDVFMGGRSFPVSAVSFTGVTTDLANAKNQSQNGHGKYFDSTGLGRRIILKSDGTYDVCTVDWANGNLHTISRYLRSSGGGTCSSCSGLCLSNYPIPNDGIIFVEDNVWLEGTINNKRLSIVAANLSGGGTQKDIYIGINNTNLRYAAYDCNNMLGLVAQRDVRVLGECPDDFVVDAALLAQTGTVGINDNGFSGKTSLTFNGAIASYLQPYFAHGNDGFAVRTYNFDNNLLYCPPPYFPTGTEFTIDLWEEL
jgi:hypothetical protein